MSTNRILDGLVRYWLPLLLLTWLATGTPLLAGDVAAEGARRVSAAELRKAGELWEQYSATSTTCKVVKLFRDKQGKISGAHVRLKTEYPTVFGVVNSYPQPPIVTRIRRTTANAQFDGNCGLIYFTGPHPLERRYPGLSVCGGGQVRCGTVHRFEPNGTYEEILDFPEVVTITTAPWMQGVEGESSIKDPAPFIVVSVILYPHGTAYGKLKEDDIAKTCEDGYGSLRWVDCEYGLP